MARNSSVSVVIMILSILAVGTFKSFRAQKTWCVAKPSSSQETLLENINYACSQVDCGVLQKGGACYLPVNPINHASVAMNLYYRLKEGKPWTCDFKKSGILTIVDPSYAGCQYV